MLPAVEDLPRLLEGELEALARAAGRRPAPQAERAAPAPAAAGAERNGRAKLAPVG